MFVLRWRTQGVGVEEIEITPKKIVLRIYLRESIYRNERIK
jgi:hypothetical protein